MAFLFRLLINLILAKVLQQGTTLQAAEKRQLSAAS